MINKTKVLVLAPHTDDGELGCGASIVRFLNEGKTVYYATFSLCKESLQEGLESDTLEKELYAATEVLGIKKENLFLADFEVRRFKQYRQEILQEMINIRNKINPDIVFVPSPTDIHQDHQVISEEGLRAFKNSTILGYEMPWNNVTFNTRCFINVSAKDLDVKLKALKKYKSQNYRAYLNDEFIKGLAKTRGVQVGSDYAEAFEVIRWIV